MLRTLALAGLITALPGLGLAQSTTGKSTVVLTADMRGTNENPPVNTQNSGSFTITMDFDVEANDDGTFENFGEAIQDGFDGFLGLTGFGHNNGDGSGTQSGAGAGNGRDGVNPMQSGTGMGTGQGGGSAMSRGVAVMRNHVKGVTVSVRGTLDRQGGPASQNITGLHIHRGRAGVNGPVVVPFDVTGTSAQSGETRLTRSATLSSSMDVDTALAIARNPSEYYLNLHTTENPAGEVRGQLRRSSDDQGRHIRSEMMMMRNEMMMLSRDMEQTRADLRRLMNSIQLREAQLNRIDANVAAIGRRNGLNTNSQEVVGSAQ